MNNELATQELDHRAWSIARLFYRSLIEFRRQYESYEEKVLKLARDTGIPREVLRLRPAELAGLLDFKQLERLRDGCIFELKELCHEIFRGRDRTDPLDRYVSDIFHEISILKEEHYTVKTYAPMYERDVEQVELDYILDEAHKLFPQKLRQVRHLFGKALKRMEQHLPRYGSQSIFIRSLYLHRDRFVKEAYPDGLCDFYRRMYPCGPLDGYFQVGLSFYHSGFFPEALESFELAAAEHDGAIRAVRRAQRAERSGDPDREHAGGGDDNGLRAPTLEDVRSTMRSLRAKVRRLRQTLASNGSPAAERRSGRRRGSPGAKKAPSGGTTGSAAIADSAAG